MINTIQKDFKITPDGKYILLYAETTLIGAVTPIYIGAVTMGTGLWNITLREINQYNSPQFWPNNIGVTNHVSMCYTDNTNTNLLISTTNKINSIGYLSYYKYNITGPTSYWVNKLISEIPNNTYINGNSSIVDIYLDATNQGLINVWFSSPYTDMYIPINTWALQGNPEATTTIAGNSASFGGAATYNGLTTYNAQVNFNYPILQSFIYNNNFQVMTATGQINTNVNQVISIGAITLTLPNAVNAKIGQIIHIHLGPNTVTAQYPTIIIPVGSNMKMCIGQNTGGVTTYTFVAATLSLRLLYIGSYTVNSVASLYWVAV